MGEAGVGIGDAGAYKLLCGEYNGEAAPAGLAIYGDIDGPGDPGLPGCGLHAGLYPGDNPLASLEPDGEKIGPGVIPPTVTNHNDIIN